MRDKQWKERGGGNRRKTECYHWYCKKKPIFRNTWVWLVYLVVRNYVSVCCIEYYLFSFATLLISLLLNFAIFRPYSPEVMRFSFSLLIYLFYHYLLLRFSNITLHCCFIFTVFHPVTPYSFWHHTTPTIMLFVFLLSVLSLSCHVQCVKKENPVPILTFLTI